MPAVLYMRHRLQRLERCLAFMEAWNGRFHVKLRNQADNSTIISVSVADAVYTVRESHRALQQCSSKEAILQSPSVLSHLDDRDTVLELVGSAAGVGLHRKTYLGTTFSPLPFEVSLVQTSDTEETPLLSRITWIIHAVGDDQSTLDHSNRLSLVSGNGARLDMMKPGFMQRGLQLVLVNQRGRTNVNRATAIRSLQLGGPSVITLQVTTLFDSYDISFHAPTFTCNPLFSLVFT